MRIAANARMKVVRVVCFIPFFLLIACGHKQPAKQAAAGGTQQQASGQPATTAPGAAAPATGQSPYQPPPPAGAQPPATVADSSNPNVSGEPVPPDASQPPAPSPATPPPPPGTIPPQPLPGDQPAAANSIAVPAGTVFRVRLDRTLDTRHSRSGDRFRATLVHGIVENGTTTIPRGTRCFGHVVVSKRSGRFKGHAVLSLSLDSFELGGRRYIVAASHAGRRSGGHKKRNLALIGGGSGAGAVIGAVAGGPAGALIGAGVGGAAGTAGAAITGKKNVRLPAETVVSFRLREPVAVSD